LKKNTLTNLGRFFHSLRAGCVLAAFHGGHGLRKIVRLALKIILVVYFLAAALFLIMRYAVLPNVDRYKPEIEQYASQKIGRQISIESIKVSWTGLNPQLSLSKFIIRDKQGVQALELPVVNTTVSWWSLAVLDLRLSKLELLQPSLKVQRDRTGVLTVAGFPLAKDIKGSDDEAGLNWILAQYEISIHDGRVQWSDELKANPELNLSDVNFVLRNNWRQHQFALQAKPPSNLAAPFDLRGNFQQSVFARKKIDTSSWSGELYSELQQADLPAIHRYFPFPIKLDKGLGSVRSWVKIEKGRLADFTADVKLTDVIGKFRRDLPILDMAQVSGRLVASERIVKGRKYLSSIFGESGHSLALVNFSMQTRDGLVLPATTLRETFTPGENGQAEKVELYAKTLDLNSLANFAEHLPIPADQRQILLEVAPKGILKEFTARWQGVFPEIANYSVKGQFLNLEMRPQQAQLARLKNGKIPAKAAIPAIPGFENLSGSIDASDKGGSFTLDSSNLSLQLPSYFLDPIMPFSRLKMEAQWQFEANDQLIFRVNHMDFQQDGAVGVVTGKHVLSMREPGLGRVELIGHLNGFDLKTIKRFIPEQTPEHLRHWLSEALLDGTANDVTLRLKGNLVNFPFKKNVASFADQEEFSVRGNIVGGHLNFLPGVFAENNVSPFWPTIENIKGSFIFDRARMEIRGDSGSTQNVAVSKVKAVIDDLSDHNAVLQIDGIALGSLQGMLNYVKASPVDHWLGDFLHDTVATGNSQLNLKLHLPLNSIIDSKVNGLLQLNNVDATLQPDLPLMSAVNGRLDFNERGVTLNALRGTMLGGSVIANGGTQKDGVIRIRLDGAASDDGIKKYFSQYNLERLFDKLSGTSNYSAQINVKKRLTEVIVESSLQGMALNFPVPLKKASESALPLRFEILPEFVANNSEQRDEIKINLGDIFNAHYWRKKGIEKVDKWKMVKGTIGVSATAQVPEHGLNIRVEQKTVNVDDWLTAFEASNLETSLGNAKTIDLKAKPEFLQYLTPTAFSVLTDELQVLGKKLEKVVVGASQQAGLWDADLDSKQASGHVTWSIFGERRELGHITARLSRLHIPKSAVADVGDLLESKNTTRRIPSVDIIADNFELLGKKLGHLEITANNTIVEQGREWHIDKLSLKNDDAELSATGKWSLREKDSLTSLNYVLTVLNAGKLLDRFEFMDVLRGGKGRLEGDMQWIGLPFVMDIPSMSGQFQLKLATGQFLKVDPGAAKLLGVLSMQSLTRRLTLDFRDVFSEGFVFDSIAGTATY
jgi:uncharacterized protein (TIGR02099 family)